MTLVIMAAGMGSRFGGLKQITPVGPNGEFIIDYSIYDAIKVGFNKVVFIIKEENYEIFRTTIGKRIENKIDVEYVFQSNDNLPNDIKIPEERGSKPLGTGQAVLCAKEVVNEPFLVINADDFYGYEAFVDAMNYIKTNIDDHAYASVCYDVVNTLTEHGTVKRGLCDIEDGYLVRIYESIVKEVNGEIIARPVNGGDTFIVPRDSRAAVNMFVFYPNVFEYFEKDFLEFLTTSDLVKEEFYMPMAVFERVKKGDIVCKSLDTKAVWKGITYAEDLGTFKEYIKSQIERGVYPVDLYN